MLTLDNVIVRCINVGKSQHYEGRYFWNLQTGVFFWAPRAKSWNHNIPEKCVKLLHLFVINKTSLLLEFCRPYEVLAVTCSRRASCTCDASFLRFLLRIRFFYEKERKIYIFIVRQHWFFFTNYQRKNGKEMEVPVITPPKENTREIKTQDITLLSGDSNKTI